MRHKYPTEAIVFSRTPLAEESALLTLLTRDLGLVRARAQGVRRPGAKLASSLATFAESDLVLVAGKEGWRVSGALLRESWFRKLPRAARTRAARIASLILRLVHGETPDSSLFETFKAFLSALSEFPQSLHDSAECLAALRVLSALGLDAGDIPEEGLFTPESLSSVSDNRSSYIVRVNRGIAASGL
jgi:recombinational DNA repair protein (RecF pathway)